MHSLFDEDCIFEAPEFHQKSSIVNKLAKSPTGGAFFFVVAWLKNSKIISGKKHHYPEAFPEIPLYLSQIRFRLQNLHQLGKSKPEHQSET